MQGSKDSVGTNSGGSSDSENRYPKSQAGFQPVFLSLWKNHISHSGLPTSSHYFIS